jgi:hypothetical protein
MCKTFQREPWESYLASVGLPAEAQYQYSLTNDHITSGDKIGAAVSLETPEPVADEFSQRDMKIGVRGHSVVMTPRLDYMVDVL